MALNRTSAKPSFGTWTFRFHRLTCRSSTRRRIEGVAKVQRFARSSEDALDHLFASVLQRAFRGGL